MQRRRILISLFAVSALGLAGLGWLYARQSSQASSEVVRLTPSKRQLLKELKAEAKFRPDNSPPLYYTGAATPEDREAASKAVDGVIDAVLARGEGSLAAKDVSAMIGGAMRQVEELETEDRDRAQGYMLEIWYILGFKGATGRFAYGAAFQKPPGYGEPLPPGWTAPDKPRPIGKMSAPPAPTPR